ncbi:MAG TPA: HU family DNA-binding protein [Acidimicrobiales bacterium]|nr:HU family DNA-binding protein [Acidimicrobiales bacterium]
MNRRDLVQAVSTQTGVERRQVDTVLQGFTQVVTAVVSKGEPVSISGFAKFVKVDRPARMGRNPQTQEPVRIKASKKARITPLKGFKDAVVKTSLAPKLERGVWPPAPTAAKKTTAKKTTAAKRSTGAAKAGGRKSTAKRSTAKKSTARKTTAKRAPAKKTTAKRATTRKAPARKTTARKTTARKTTTARKAAGAKKTTKR